MRLLFITSNRLGDAVLSTSVLRHFVETRPELRITVACGPVAAPIFEAVPNLERIIRMPKQKRGGHWLHLWKSVVTNWWDVIIDLRGSATAYVLPGRKRIVLSGNDDSMHRVEQLGRLIGVNPPLRPKIWLDQKHIDEARELLPQDERPILAVGPTANWPGKMWPVERFVELVACLRAADGLLPNAHVIVAGAPNEREAAMPVIESIADGDITSLFGERSLLTVQACLTASDLYVGNDSGLMHMAAAAAIPTLGLFGPSRVENYGPFGEKTAFVRTDRSYDEIWSTADYKSSNSEMYDLSVEKVLFAIEGLLKREGRGG
ncbi:glycosyltransferase family 9 protein [Thalassospira sp. TSL5-1]|uniref:glycosyltransferase family 9 protein n=1 Tax=Thalassospira sp. TSL5-1 TaxID=1544451 RepID=UPI0009390EF4|nr:glycosyltransferase family 9 protein [Thalassospira sp. TSL5-1]OKH88264.1 glycosyl transferase [Thalassospira sp. TSL5-1]